MVTVALIVCLGPNQLYLLLCSLTVPMPDDVFLWTTMLAELNVCVNPLLYASKHEAVRKQVKEWLQHTGRLGVSRVGPAPPVLAHP